jgi:hypothetical protein
MTTVGVEGTDIVTHSDAGRRRESLSSLAAAGRFVGVEPDVARAAELDIPEPGAFDAELGADAADVSALGRTALHLSFDGFGAAEAASDALLDNAGSNRVSETLGYERNGTDWDTRRGEPALIQRWRITREQWLLRRRDDVALSGVEARRQTCQATS